MAPKSARSVTDKNESVRQARLAKEGCDGHAIRKRALDGSTKIGSETNTGAVRDGRDQSRGAQPDNKPKDKLQNKTQPSITDFLAYEDSVPLLKDPPILMEASGEASRVELGARMEMKSGENSLNSKNPRDCGEGPMNEAKRLDQKAREDCAGKDRSCYGGAADRNRLLETEKAEYDGRNGEWLREGGDKFYLLTESETASSRYDLNDEEGSGSSEAESLAERMSPVVGPTVQPQCRHHKRIKSRTGSGGIMNSPAATLKWDYSGIRLSHSEKVPQAPSDTVLTSNLIENENCPGELVDNLASSDTKMLQLICGTVRVLQNETRAENQKARVATKQLQVTVRMIAKSCSEIVEKLNTVESRSSVVEGEMAALKDHVVTQCGQLTDVMWKLEDFENRQRKNNLRFLGIEEGAEGGEIRTFMIKLLSAAFPELVNWNLQSESQS
ncbi:hypothetical protein NDU88_005042 [Pleurodeles waltl]|uniref:Uncharacterized protein n=1 Tax=Pleurodeles waltl TaxID=8319 RepID=A0AAV7MVL0_PLEWA|nr:hypothetical protein NDU88_005042 [Pleurodeles waltl]